MKNSLTMCGTKNELAEAKMNPLAYLSPRAAANLLLLQQVTSIDQSENFAYQKYSKKMRVTLSLRFLLVMFGAYQY